MITEWTREGWGTTWEGKKFFSLETISHKMTMIIRQLYGDGIDKVIFFIINGVWRRFGCLHKCTQSL